MSAEEGTSPWTKPFRFATLVLLVWTVLELREMREEVEAARVNGARAISAANAVKSAAEEAKEAAEEAKTAAEWNRR